MKIFYSILKLIIASVFFLIQRNNLITKLIHTFINFHKLLEKWQLTLIFKSDQEFKSINTIMRVDKWIIIMKTFLDTYWFSFFNIWITVRVAITYIISNIFFCIFWISSSLIKNIWWRFFISTLHIRWCGKYLKIKKMKYYVRATTSNNKVISSVESAVLRAQTNVLDSFLTFPFFRLREFNIKTIICE